MATQSVVVRTAAGQTFDTGVVLKLPSVPTRPLDAYLIQGPTEGRTEG